MIVFKKKIRQDIPVFSLSSRWIYELIRINRQQAELPSRSPFFARDRILFVEEEMHHLC